MNEISTWTDRLRDREISDAVIEALEATDRAAFLPADADAYGQESAELPLVRPMTRLHRCSQSPPVSVQAVGLDLLDVQPGHRVLEIGSGCGYTLALLHNMGATVVGVEALPELVSQSATALEDQGYTEVQVVGGCGIEACAELGPWDRILVSCSITYALPLLLAESLNNDGRVVAAVTNTPGTATAWRVLDRDQDGELSARSAGLTALLTEDGELQPGAFVPLLGSHGFDGGYRRHPEAA